MIRPLMISLIALFGCMGCSSKEKNQLRVAATPVPHAEMLEFARSELKAKGIDLEIIVTDDYHLPNRALAEREVDANFFQHIPYMNEQIQQFHDPIEVLVKVEIEPMGIYSQKLKTLADLQDHATVALTNDPSNEARALLLLQERGLIQLDDTNPLQATVLNIRDNPKHLHFIELDAAMVSRCMQDVDLAVINTNYALDVKLSPLKDALALESRDSPYANIVAIRQGEDQDPKILALKEVMTSDRMREFIDQTYQGAVLPAF